MAEAKISKLKIKRNTVIAQQQRVKDFIDAKLATASVQELETRSQALEKYYSDFQMIQSNIEELEGDDSEAIRANFEELYFTLRPALLVTTAEYKRGSDEGKLKSCTTLSFTSKSAKLPEIPLPTFSGDYTQWLSYYESFSSLVHRNAALDNVARFHYLRSSLRDGALRRIQAIEVTADNYEVAIKSLVERYQRRNIIVREHIRQLFNTSSIVNKKGSLALRELIDSVSIHLRALTSLGRPVAHWDDLIIEIVLSKLDNTTLEKWNDEAPTERLATLDEVFKFLEKRCNHMEERSSVQQGKLPLPNTTNYSKPYKQASFVQHRSSITTGDGAPTPRVCTFCKGTNHLIYRCHKFAALNSKQRVSAINQRNLCQNCLKAGHAHTICESEKCRISLANSAPMLNAAQSSVFSALKNNPTVISKLHQPKFTVLLATTLVQVINRWGAPILCRALLDSGSQLSFISERVAVQLGIRRQYVCIAISGIGETNRNVRHSITTTIRSNTSDFSVELKFFVLPCIAEHHPDYHLDITQWNLPLNLPLADPAFFKSQKIDLLLGAEIFMDLLISEQIRLRDDCPILQNTKLGWVVTGRAPMTNQLSLQCSKTYQNPTIALETLLRQFWEIETHAKPTMTMTAEERLCESHFLSTVNRTEAGRFCVRLPFKEPPSSLGNSFTIAKRRFHTLERKLERDKTLREQYCQFMREYEGLHHMTRLENSNEYISDKDYFLPHHCVLKAESSTTKLRVVFDASAKTSTNVSLNDVLMTGPTVQSDLFSVIIRFRMYRFVFTTDISKMYRQIVVDPEDRRYQRILWRENPSAPLGVYQLNTVTYGTSAAPYLATRCLSKLAEDHSETQPAASTALLSETYVDDIMTGADTLEKATSLLFELQGLLNKARLELRKYCSNTPEILKLIPEEHREPYLNIGDNEVVKTLGLIWQPAADTFTYHFSFQESGKITKRSVLSDLGKIFDPLGLLGPVIVLGKIFMQQLWKLKLSWDQPLPEHYEKRWTKYVKQLETLNSLQFPRHLLSQEVSKSIQLHSFSDSSEVAYGACCYLRSINQANQVTVKLICAKSRVAPATATSIAKLELQAALLMAELVERLLSILPITVNENFFYTDSKIVLAWLAKPSYTWTTFVANRVAKIQDLTREKEWGYVNTKENPADIISRGSLPEEFLKSSLWNCGPAFLSKLELCRPAKPEPAEHFCDIPEKRPFKLVLLATNPTLIDLTAEINHCDSLHKLERIVGYCLRFINNANMSKYIKITGPLLIAELAAASTAIICNIQRIHFATEYKALSKNYKIDKASRIRSLDPFLDPNGLIRVGGRLQNSLLKYASKHQIILPNKCNFTNLLVSSYHRMYLHAGPQTLHSILRQRYWPINGKTLCRNIVHKCVRCFRNKPIQRDLIMGNLPKERVIPGRAFLTTGIDFCGPFPIHSRIRGRTPIKGYLAIFVCFTTKAIHIETVSDLSTAAFIAALRRFIARRGLCTTIFSDNATNFLGAKNELSELYHRFQSKVHNEALLEFCGANRITWRTIPPKSPHFGGLWEAAVKQAKHHLVRVVAGAALTYEELSTIVAQIEAILNSRPLTPLSSDPSDLEALTPGHFLIGEPLTSFPEPDLTDINYNRLSRFQRLQQLQQHFWKRWSKEYLHLLQQRNKWTTKGKNLSPGALVLLQDDNLPPYKWSLGRVITTIRGKDGVHRVAEVKTQHGVYKRAIVRLFPLPIEN